MKVSEFSVGQAIPRASSLASEVLIAITEVPRLMQTTVNLPDALHHSVEALAESCGSTVEQFIVEAVKKEVQSIGGQVALPLIHSRQPGTLDLSKFDFDDLLT